MGWSKKNGVWNLHREPTCLCAFDADPGNYVRNGSGVSRLDDLTGHGYHALQPTALNQPTWIEKDSDFGGHGSLNFNGTSSFLYVQSIELRVQKLGTGDAQNLSATAVYILE